LTEELEEANIRGLVMLHMQENQGGQLEDLPEYNDEDYYEDDDYYNDSREEEFAKSKPGKVTQTLFRTPNGTVINTNVINKAGYPQVVIIPHYLDETDKKIRLRFDDNHVIDFETSPSEDGSIQSGNLQSAEPTSATTVFKAENPFQRLVLRPTDPVNNTELSELNERRREALLRASEKQELLLQNLLDAVERHRQEVQRGFLEAHRACAEGEPCSSPDKELQVETVVEEAIRKQLTALTGLKHSVEDTPTGVEPFVEERLNLLEDASHRQLEIMESLIDAVQKLDSKSDRAEDRLRVLERIAENQNLMIDKLSVVQSENPTLRSTSTTTTQLSGFPGGNPRPDFLASAVDEQPLFQDEELGSEQEPRLPKDLSVEESQDALNGQLVRLEDDPADEKRKQRLILDQMEKLHTHLITQQKRVHEDNLEAQREAVRDEMESMAEVLLNLREPQAVSSTPEQRREALAQMRRHRPELVSALQQKIPGILGGENPPPQRPPRKIAPSQSVAHPRVVAWHQRFVDNFKLRKLHSRAMKLNSDKR